MAVLAWALFAGSGFACFASAREGSPASVPAPVSGPVDRPSDRVDPVTAAEAAPPVPPDGDAVAGVADILALPSEEVTEPVLASLEAALTQLSGEELEALEEQARRLPRDGRRALVHGELAYVHLLLGQPEDARRYAAMAGSASSRSRAVADAVLGGGVADLMPADPVIGAVLPVTGSPSSREYARLFMEGVEVALELARRAGWRVELVVEDNRGTASGSARSASALVSRGAVAVLGPLTADNLEAAVRATSPRVVFLSPTARRMPFGRRGVYSMGAGDPGAGRALAEAVRRAGHLQAALVHPRSPGEALEADAFQGAFAALGGVVDRRLRYEPGTTTFDVELKEVEAAVPDVLVIAAPPSDVELLAPQIAFFGLDTLDIQVAGTAAWTTPAVLEAVVQRHTDSVIAVSASDPLAVFDPAAAFVQAYEQHFRRTLVSPVPAVGFDLFRMALAAYGEGVRNSRGTVASLERLDRFRGATGTYSHMGGGIEREFFPVRILEGRLHPLDAALVFPTDTVAARSERPEARSP